MPLQEFHTNPDLYRLYEVSSESPELDRVLGNIRRHKSRGFYDREKALHSVNRYVVEPSAIGLSDGKWWEKYPARVRLEVADMVLRGWEKEL